VISSASDRTTARRVRIRRIRVAGLLLIVVAATAAAVGDPLPASSPSPAFSSITDPPPLGVPRGDGLGVADGAVPDGTTAFDDGIPGVANLDPALLGALRRAAAHAASEGIELVVDSGWRSGEYQEHLLREAVAKHGSEQEAARWVAPPDRSAHVSGHAVDIGPPAAAGWLSEHGATYGLCQVYDNEPWHFELWPEAVELGCPPRYADPTHDPRMQA
jgi:hypothetical protein